MPEEIAATKYRFNGFTNALTSGRHDFNLHVFKWMLTNVQPLSGMSSVSDIDELSAGNGYAAGGVTAILLAHYEQEGSSIVAFRDVMVNASGGDVGPFRYVVLANQTANELCWFYDLKDPVTIADSSAMSLDIKGSSLTISTDANAI